MTKFQAIIDPVLLGSMRLGGLSRIVRSNHVDNARFYYKKMGVRSIRHARGIGEKKVGVR